MENKLKSSKFKYSTIILIGVQRIREWLQFYKRNFDAPFPTSIKRKTLTSHSLPKSNWIETGTYMGSASKYLSKRYPHVTTIEPSKHFFDLSKSRFGKSKNIHLLFGSSEEHFEKAVKLEKSNLNIWLDGHFSEGGTFLGETVSPIIHELMVISKQKERFENIVVFVDDVRLFTRNVAKPTGYPPLTFLFDWAEENGFSWEIQNDIFIAKFKQ